MCTHACMYMDIPYERKKAVWLRKTVGGWTICAINYVLLFVRVMHASIPLFVYAASAVANHLKITKIKKFTRLHQFFTAE